MRKKTEQEVEALKLDDPHDTWAVPTMRDVTYDTRRIVCRPEPRKHLTATTISTIMHTKGADP